MSTQTSTPAVVVRVPSAGENPDPEKFFQEVEAFALKLAGSNERPPGSQEEKTYLHLLAECQVQIRTLTDDILRVDLLPARRSKLWSLVKQFFLRDSSEYEARINQANGQSAAQHAAPPPQPATAQDLSPQASTATRSAVPPPPTQPQQPVLTQQALTVTLPPQGPQQSPQQQNPQHQHARQQTQNRSRCREDEGESAEDGLYDGADPFGIFSQVNNTGRRQTSNAANQPRQSRDLTRVLSGGQHGPFVVMDDSHKNKFAFLNRLSTYIRDVDDSGFEISRELVLFYQLLESNAQPTWQAFGPTFVLMTADNPVQKVLRTRFSALKVAYPIQASTFARWNASTNFKQTYAQSRDYSNPMVMLWIGFIAELVAVAYLWQSQPKSFAARGWEGPCPNGIQHYIKQVFSGFDEPWTSSEESDFQSMVDSILLSRRLDEYRMIPPEARGQVCMHCYVILGLEAGRIAHRTMECRKMNEATSPPKERQGNNRNMANQYRPFGQNQQGNNYNRSGRSYQFQGQPFYNQPRPLDGGFSQALLNPPVAGSQPVTPNASSSSGP